MVEELVLYGAETSIAKMIETLAANPAARSNLRALACEAGVNLPEHTI